MGMVATLCPLDESLIFKGFVIINPKRPRAPQLKIPVEELMDLLYESEGAADTDKAWDMLHRCLNKGVQMPLRQTAAAMAIMGEIEIDADGEVVNFVSAATVPSVAKALNDFDLAEIDRIVPTFDSGEVYCVTGDDDEGYVRQAFESVKQVFNKAMESKKAVGIMIG